MAAFAADLLGLAFCQDVPIAGANGALGAKQDTFDRGRGAQKRRKQCLGGNSELNSAGPLSVSQLQFPSQVAFTDGLFC